MIARATLALFLAGPVLASGLTMGSGTAAATTVPRKGSAPIAARDKTPSLAQRRLRSANLTASRQEQPPAIVASFDDGFAYDTPRDAFGHPIRTSSSGKPIPWQVGTASWYGGAEWQGKRMSDGTRYEQNNLTAAHASLPLGSRVRVSLAADDSCSVVVRITDRPGTRTRVIDLSRGAAAQLGILSQGLAKVRLDPL